MDERSIQRKRRNLELDARLGRKLASVRKKNGITQQEVADHMEFGRPLVSKIEAGQRALSAVEIPDYTEAIGWNPQELVKCVIEYSSDPRYKRGRQA